MDIKVGQKYEYSGKTYTIKEILDVYSIRIVTLRGGRQKEYVVSRRFIETEMELVSVIKYRRKQ